MAETSTNVEPKKTTKKIAVKFYFPRSAKKSYRKENFSIRAENNVYVLDPSNKNYKDILDFLRKHRENVDNGGSVFFELSADSENESSRGRLIDKLLDMNVSQLRRACGDDIEYQLIHTKGPLIDIYLKQQGF